MLVRYGQDVKTGAPKVITIYPEESDALDRVAYGRAAYLAAWGDFNMLIGPWGENLTIADALARVAPRMRQVCGRAA